MAVEDLFADDSYTCKRSIPADTMTSLDRRRMLVHLIGEVADEILLAPGSDPVGMAVTITRTEVEGQPIFEVMATAPQYSARQI